MDKDMESDPVRKFARDLMDHKDAYVRGLALSHVLREKVLARVLDLLDLPRGSQGLDLGCGVGLPAMMAARTGLCVTGVDLRKDFIEMASQAPETSGDLKFIQGNGMDLAFDNDLFDWAWSIDCVYYHPAMGTAALDEMKRVLKPGGRLVLAAWSSQRLLPGYPVLEARLNTVSMGLAPYTPGMDPASDFFALPRVFGQSGFKKIRSATIVRELSAPFSSWERRAIADLFQMRWGRAPEELGDEDLAQYRDLVDPEGRHFILDIPGYYGFFTYTLFSAIKE